MAASAYPNLLPPNATKLERALAGPTGRLDNAIAVPIDTLLDAYKCPATYLPWLAWHLSLDLWDWEWDEAKRREVIALAIKLARAKGTALGLRMATSIMGSEITQIITPPQGFFASRDFTKAEWDTWIHLMPELRIKLIEGVGQAGVDEWFTDNGDQSGLVAPDINWTWQVYQITSPAVLTFDSQYPTEVEGITRATAIGGLLAYGPAINPSPISPPVPNPAGSKFGICDQSWVGLDDGWVLHGRRVILRQNNVDVPMQHATMSKEYFEGKLVEVQRVSTIGLSTKGWFVRESAADDDRYVCYQEREAKLYTIRLEGSYMHESSVLGLTMLVPGMAPMDPRYERDSDIGIAGPFDYANDFFTYEGKFLQHDMGADMLADRIFLLDENVAGIMTRGISFTGIDRVSMQPYTAEVMVDLKLKEPLNAWFQSADDSFVGQAFVVNMEKEQAKIERACRAIVTAKAFRDKILVDFAPLRQREPQDLTTSTSTAGDWLTNAL